MKWFKHMTASWDDEKLSAVTDTLGLEGYGFYWRLLEVVAEKLDAKNETFCVFSPKKWSNFFQISPKKFQKFARILAELHLISVEISENFIKIDIPNLLKYRDNYSKNLQASMQATDKNVSIKNKNKIKEEELTPRKPPTGGDTHASPARKTPSYPAEFETFWKAYPKKTGKDAALRAWQNKKREKRLPDLPELIPKLEAFKQSDQWTRDGGQYVPNPSTWLNQARWLDELQEEPRRTPLFESIWDDERR